jgi:hypothetical protein
LGLEGAADFETLRGCCSYCTEASSEGRGGLSTEELALLGRRCKRLLDGARLQLPERVTDSPHPTSLRALQTVSLARA